MSSPCYCTSLRAATRRIAAAYDEALAPIGININQFSLLRTIARHAPLTLTELGRLKELDRSTIGRNVRVLEKQGLLRLGRGEDQREAVVTLTEAGSDSLAEATPLWEAVQTRIDERLGPLGAQALYETLNAI